MSRTVFLSVIFSAGTCICFIAKIKIHGIIILPVVLYECET